MLPQRVCLLFVLAICATAQPKITGVLNAGDFSQRLCPGLNVAILGSGLGPATPVTSQPVVGLSVSVNGENVPLVFSSAGELIGQFPYDLTIGPGSLVVTYQNQASAPLPIQISQYAPALFFQNGGVFATFIRPNGVFGSASNPALQGETINLLAAGLGPTNPPATAGPTAPVAAPATAPVTVTIGGEPAKVLFAGLAGRVVNGFGIYTVTVIVPGNVSGDNLPVTISVGGFTSAALILPVYLTGLGTTQSGFTFQAVQGGGAPSPKTFKALNGTQQPLDFTLSASTLSGGSWLSVTPSSGSVASGGQSSAVTVSVNPAGLSPGDYYGQIRVDAPGAPNTPQLLSIVLNVSPPTVNPGPVVEPTGLTFVALAGASPASQTVRITNLTSQASPFTATGTVTGAQNWFTFTPSSGTVAPNTPSVITVQANTSNLPVGTYRGTLTLNFPQDKTTRAIDLLLVVTPSLPPSPAITLEPHATSAAATCTPTKLLPVFSLLGNNFAAVVSWPNSVEVIVVDDCGSPLKSGGVTVTFSNGDPQLNLVTGGDGRWAGTWAAVNPRTSSLTVTAKAQDSFLNLSGTAQVGGAAAANPLVPAVNANGIVSAGSYSAMATPSPGELVSVFGSAMADGTEQASALPLPTKLQATRLTVGGKPVPLVFTSAGQINAQLSYDLPPFSTPQLVVQNGNRLSVPQTVTIGASQPAIFTVNSTGKGQGHIYGFPTATEQILADSANPAKAGEVIVIYCTGLGPVTPPVTAGDAVPADVLHQTANPVTLTIGGVSAPVAFAGVTAGFTGLYQINATVPAGVAAGNAVPVVVTVGVSVSPTVTMAVQ